VILKAFEAFQPLQFLGVFHEEKSKQKYAFVERNPFFPAHLTSIIENINRRNQSSFCNSLVKSEKNWLREGLAACYFIYAKQNRRKSGRKKLCSTLFIMNAARFLRAFRMTEKISIFKSKISNSTFRISGSKYVEMKTKFSF